MKTQDDPASGLGSILVVDSDEGTRLVLQRLLESQGYAVTTARDAAHAAAAIGAACPDVIVLDLPEPGRDGTALCQRLRSDPATAWIPIVIVTARPEDEQVLQTCGADGIIHKPFKREELLSWVRALLRARQMQLDAARMESVLVSVAALAEARSVYREDHLLRVARYSGQLAEALGLGDRTAATIRRAALLHDVGMIAVPDAILRQPRSLTPAEFAKIKRHAVLGAELSRVLPDGSAISAIIRGHHERWHGEGYPDGLAGERIPVGARIVAVADAFDALTTERPYRAALSMAEALEVLWFGAEAQWDPSLVEAFAAIVRPRPARTAKLEPREIVTRYMALTPERP
jgi:putative two-component system response regulator